MKLGYEQIKSMEPNIDGIGGKERKDCHNDMSAYEEHLSTLGINVAKQC
jgi:hypothetical protein